MNISLGLTNNTHFSGPDNKSLSQKLQQAKLDKSTKHHQSSKDLKIPSAAFRSGNNTPKNERGSSHANSPKSFSSAASSYTPKGSKTGSNVSGGLSNRNKSWNMTPQPSSFRSPKDSVSSKFINTTSQHTPKHTPNNNKSLSKFLDSRLDTKDRSTVEDSSYFDSMKLFTEEGDNSILHSARRKSTELNASLRQNLLRTIDDKSKSATMNKVASAKTLKSPKERLERPASSQFGKAAVNSGGKTPDLKEKLNKTKTISEGGGSSLSSKILYTNWKDVDNESCETPSKLGEDEDRICLKDILRMGSKTPQPDSATHSSFSASLGLGSNDQMRQLMKEREQDKKLIKALQEQIMTLQGLFDEVKGARDSPDFAQNKAEKGDFKDKEMSFLKIQNDTLKMTVDILKGENDILKNAQKQVAQFKEAAKRYRDLANSKSDECVRLAEEVINLRKNNGLTPTSSSTQLPTPGKYDPTIKVESIFSPKSNRNIEKNLLKMNNASFNGQTMGTETLETEANEITRPPQPEVACKKPELETKQSY